MVDLPELPPLDRFQNYLLLIARANSDCYNGVPIDIHDLVQQTLLKAQQNFEQFRGTTDGELAGWLNTILVNQLTDQLRRAGRELDEQALARRLEQSSVRFERLLLAEQSTPSQHAVQDERFQQLAKALMRLPDDQRQAIELRHLRELPVAEIADRMQRTIPSVAGLLQRGIRRLREMMGQPAEELEGLS